MLGWFRGNQGEEHPNDDNINNMDDDMAFAPEPDYDATLPPTPGAATFAYQAIRYGLLGTPKPSDPVSGNKHDQLHQRLEESEHSDVERDIFGVNVKDFAPKSSKRTERMLDFEVATPLRKSVAPQGILLTPGTALGRKKSVTFGPNDYSDGSAPEENGQPRVRSGLPASYPGKFPSPWTPKIISPSKKKASSTPSLVRAPVEVYEDSDDMADEREAKPKRRVERQSPRKYTKTSTLALDLKSGNALQTTVKSQLHVLKNNTAVLNEMIAADGTDFVDADVTISLDEPKSRSGKYWRKKYTATIDGAEQRVEYYKNRKDTSVEFASKKDAQCSDLAVRLHEEIELRHKLQAEVDKWQKLAESRSCVTNNEGYSAFRLHEKMTRENLEYRERIRKQDKELRDLKLSLDRQAKENLAYREHVDTLEQEMAQKDDQLETQSLNPKDGDLKTNLQQKKAKYELKEIESLKAKQESMQLDLEKSRKETEKLRFAKDKLAEELKQARQENQQLQKAALKLDNHDMDHNIKISEMIRKLDDATSTSQEKDRTHKTEISCLKAEITESRDELAIFKAENEALKKEFITLKPDTKPNNNKPVQHSPVPPPLPALDVPIEHPILDTSQLPTKSNQQHIKLSTQTKAIDELVRLDQLFSSPRKTPIPSWKEEDIPDLPPLSPTSSHDASDDSACDNSYDRLALSNSRPSKKDEDEYTPIFKPLILPSRPPDKTKGVGFKPTAAVSPAKNRAYSNLANRPSSPSKTVRPASPVKTRIVPSTLRSGTTAMSMAAESPRPKMVLLDESLVINKYDNKAQSTRAFPDPKDVGAMGKKSNMDDPARRAAAAARVAERREKLRAEANKENVR